MRAHISQACGRGKGSVSMNLCLVHVCVHALEGKDNPSRVVKGITRNYRKNL